MHASTIASSHRSMSLQSKEKSQVNHLVANPTIRESLVQLEKKYSHSKELQDVFLQLKDAIESEEQTKIYCVIDARKYHTQLIASKCEEAMKAAGCDDVSVEIHTHKEKIRCEEATMLKVCYKIASDFCKKIYTENSGADTYLNLSFFDTKILYESDEENGPDKLFSRILDGICIIISERKFEQTDKFMKNIYTKKLTDLENIPPSSVDDLNLVDIEKSIDAHYGIIEDISSKEFVTWRCVIPADVYEIRPETLDLSEPIDAKYNWPAAVELEKNFIKKLKRSHTGISLHKIDYAISVIKKYHYHQMRKSGEPYYMHPISVANLLLDTLEEKTFVQEKLLQNKEPLLVAALLHDVLEDTSYTKAALTKNFGTKVRDMVLAVTKINYNRRAVLLSNKQAFQDLIDKEPLSLCIKLADRLHNLITLDGHPSIGKREKVAQETLDFFVKPAEKYCLEKLATQLRQASEWVLKHGKVDGYGF